jgi:hypothetical protein
LSEEVPQKFTFNEVIKIFRDRYVCEGADGFMLFAMTNAKAFLLSKYLFREIAYFADFITKERSRERGSR